MRTITAENKSIDVQKFLGRLDDAAQDETDLLVFAYQQGSDGSITRLDQRWKP